MTALCVPTGVCASQLVAVSSVIALLVGREQGVSQRSENVNLTLAKTEAHVSIDKVGVVFFFCAFVSLPSTFKFSF